MSSAILCALRVQTVTGVSEIVVSPSATFAFVWLTRRAATDVAATAMLFGIEVAALALGTVAAWLGGELVDRLGGWCRRRSEPERGKFAVGPLCSTGLKIVHRPSSIV